MSYLLPPSAVVLMFEPYGFTQGSFICYIIIERERECSPYSLEDFGSGGPTFSKHQPSGPILSMSRFVHMFVCLCV